MADPARNGGAATPEMPASKFSAVLLPTGERRSIRVAVNVFAIRNRSNRASRLRMRRRTKARAMSLAQTKSITQPSIWAAIASAIPPASPKPSPPA